MKIDIDLKNFNSLLKNIQEDQEQAFRLALSDVGDQIASDVEPYVPVDEGTLVGSTNVAVSEMNPQFKFSGRGDQGKITSPNTSGMKPFELRVSYNTSYAQEIHDEYKTRDESPGKKTRIKYLGKGFISDIEDEEGARDTGDMFLADYIKKNQDQIFKDLEHRIKVRLKQ